MTPNEREIINKWAEYIVHELNLRGQIPLSAEEYARTLWLVAEEYKLKTTAELKAEIKDWEALAEYQLNTVLEYCENLRGILELQQENNSKIKQLCARTEKAEKMLALYKEKCEIQDRFLDETRRELKETVRFAVTAGWRSSRVEVGNKFRDELKDVSGRIMYEGYEASLDK